jgi:hypothetical protein
MAVATKLLQLRLAPELYEAIAKEVERRKRAGHMASLAGVATECLEDRFLDGQSQRDVVSKEDPR